MRIGQGRGISMMRLCSLFGYTRQAFYQHQRTRAYRQLESELIIQQVMGYRKLQKHMGGRKLLLLLGPFFRQHNIQLGRDEFFDLLRHHGLLIRKRNCKVPKTTFSQHWMRKYPDLVSGFVPSAAGQLWVSDITYIRLSGGFAYLSLVTDAYSRKIIGFHLSERLSAAGCIAALKMAISSRNTITGLIHHSDRGSQYCSSGYVELLELNDISISMTQGGDPRDNAIAERVNGILKNELLEVSYNGITEAGTAIAKAVKTYNYLRPHSSVSMLTPALAHGRDGELKRHWKNYYKPSITKEVTMDG
jgi:putative transposase